MRDKQPPYRLLHSFQQRAALSGVRPPAKVSQEAEQYLYQNPVCDRPIAAATTESRTSSDNNQN